jgi:allantoate deiminase
MQSCDQLAAISQSDTSIDRQYLTAEHKAANAQVANWMQTAGMHTHTDGAGNLIGRYPSQAHNAKRLLIGSHLDTVPNSGKYDGILGVLSPLALIHHLHQAGIDLPFHIDLIGFADEEGTRFGTTLLGSRALTGQWQPEWASLTDKKGISLEQAMDEFGLSFEEVSKSQITPTDDLIGYLEWHIEQGPMLEAKDAPVGVVTAIAGAKRFIIELSGFAGHAGTVPMGLRQDALAGAAEMILAVEAIAKQEGVVATVGQIHNSPNGVNVIAGGCQFSLDICSEQDAERDRALQLIWEEMASIAAKRHLTFTRHKTHSAPSVQCDRQLTNIIAESIEQSGYSALRLPSGAGHDAMAMADICPVAMLFIRCEQGISHHPNERVSQQDVAAGIEVMAHVLQTLADPPCY